MHLDLFIIKLQKTIAGSLPDILTYFVAYSSLHSLTYTRICTVVLLVLIKDSCKIYFNNFNGQCLWLNFKIQYITYQRKFVSKIL